MYLASLYIVLDLDPEVLATDRSRLLRSLREKLKQKFTHRLTVSIDEQETSLAGAFFDENYERIKARLENMCEFIEGMGEARIRFHQEQIFGWFEGKFVETSDRFIKNDDKTNLYGNKTKIYSSNSVQSRTIVYTDSDDDDMRTPIPSRFSRRNLRIPTRK